jgi:hypothetical protein
MKKQEILATTVLTEQVSFEDTELEEKKKKHNFHQLISERSSRRFDKNDKKKFCQNSFVCIFCLDCISRFKNYTLNKQFHKINCHKHV